jgi:hypothetical protein
VTEDSAGAAREHGRQPAPVSGQEAEADGAVDAAMDGVEPTVPKSVIDRGDSDAKL